MHKRLFIFLFSLIPSLVFAGNNLAIPKDALVGAALDVTFVAKFALFISLLLLGIIFIGKFLKILFNLPIIAGQIIAGIILGPSFINLKNLYIFQDPLRIVDELSGHFYYLASSDVFVFIVILISVAFTVSYLLWIAGHETDIKDMLKVGVTSTTAGILGALAPIGMLVLVTYLFLGGEYTLVRSIGIGVIFAATSVSIPVAMLFSSNKMSLRSSKATLGAAVIDDVFTIVILSIFTICLNEGVFGCVEGNIGCNHQAGILMSMLHILLAFILMFAIGYWLFPLIINWMKRKKYNHLITPFANSSMLAFFALAELLGGLAGITGAYFAGLFHRRVDNKHEAEKTISPYVSSFLLPLFLGSIGLQVDISILTLAEWGIVILFLLVAILSKMFGCYVATFLSNLFGRKGYNRWTILEGYLFGSAMVARGEVGLVVATILKGTQLITPSQYVIVIVVIILSTIACPIMLSIGFHEMKKGIRLHKDKDYTLNLGRFRIIGTNQMFNIIMARIELEKKYNTSVHFSEGRKIVNIEGLHLKLIYSPNEGIIIKGDKEKVEEVLKTVKSFVLKDIEKIPEI